MFRQCEQIEWVFTEARPRDTRREAPATRALRVACRAASPLVCQSLQCIFAQIPALLYTQSELTNFLFANRMITLLTFITLWLTIQSAQIASDCTNHHTGG